MSFARFRADCSFALIFLALEFGTLVVCNGQPTQAEVQLMQHQLKELQDKLNSIEAPTDEPFAGRVKSVGHSNKPVAPAQPVAETLSIRLYDLSDIFAVSPQYPALHADEFTGAMTPFFQTVAGGMVGASGIGGGGGQGGGSFSMPSAMPVAQSSKSLTFQEVRVSIDSLINAITSTVEPEMWEDSPGEATVQVLGNTLLISATDSMHTQIASLLNLFREHWGHLRTVSVAAYWIKASPSDIGELLRSPDGSKKGVGLVDDEKWVEFLQSAIATQRVVYSATLNGHSGQTLHAISGRERSLVSGGEELEATTQHTETETITSAVNGFKPEITQFHEGAALQVTPLATRGGNYLILDLHTRVTELLADDAKQSRPAMSVVDGAGNKSELVLDRGDYVSYRLSTTVRCPKDRIVLAGGMTYDRAATTEFGNLYLFVRTAIHTIEEDVSDRKIE